MENVPDKVFHLTHRGIEARKLMSLIPTARTLVPMTDNLARCSRCKRVFVRQSNDPDDLRRQFEAHACPASKDANQAAARFMREGINDYRQRP